MGALKIYFNEEETAIAVPQKELDLATERVLLLVDDDPVILETLKHQASKYYNKIHCFDSAERARLFISNTQVRFDTALIDYFLPGDLGHQITGQIKKKEGAKTYLMTGDLEHVPLKNVKNFDACLSKPLKVSHLKAIFCGE